MKTFGEKSKEMECYDRHGAYGIVLKGDCVLMERGDLGYFLPGGGLEEGETAEEALCREVLEETGCQVSSYKKCADAAEYTEREYRSYQLRKVNSFYIVELEEQSDNPTAPAGSDYRVEWVRFEEIQDKIFPDSHRWAIREAMS